MTTVECRMGRVIVKGQTNLDGQVYEVQASTNLLLWLPLTNFSGTGMFQFVGPEAVRFPRRFYRAVAP